MRRFLGYLLYLLAIAITALVIAGKYFGVVPAQTALVMSDPAASLLFALLLAFVSKWI